METPEAVPLKSTIPPLEEVKHLVYNELARICVGICMLVFNTCLLLLLNESKHIRRKFALYTLVAIGDTLIGSYFLYASIGRIVDIATQNYFYGTSSRDCMLKFYVLPRIFGGELVAVAMLILSLEKIVAVFFPLYYRWRSGRLRLIMVAVGLLWCIATVVWMITGSLLKTKQIASDRYCGISNSVTEEFAIYYQINVVVINLLAFCLCSIAFIVAWQRSKRFQNARKDLHLIKPILAISAISTIILIARNVIYMLRNFTTVRLSNEFQSNVVTYASAAFTISKIFIYLLTGREFRIALRKQWKPISMRINAVNPL